MKIVLARLIAIFVTLFALSSPIYSGQLEKGLSKSIRSYFFKTEKYTVIDRTKLEEVLKEHKLQLSGCNTKECLVEIGKILNVNYIVVPSLSKIGDEYVMNLRITSVESSEIVLFKLSKPSKPTAPIIKAG